VDNFVPNFGLLAILKARLAARRRGRDLLLSLVVALFLGLLGGSAAAAPGAYVQKAPVTSGGPGRSFAIADFDGDHRPDLASVRAGRSDSSSTNYWIQLQLTAAGWQSVQVVGPIGGLQIAARDVNGDHAVDLVLTTAWLNQPIAIFLNDGHGSFSRVEPTAFPEAFSESKTKWVPSANLATDAVGMPPQSGAGICSEENGSLHGRWPAGSISYPDTGFLVSPLLASHAGRAPPAQVLNF
jgi:hypothetical protein